jgi:FKBP-type peptidyl-prolyl cis-trans isomerase
MTPRPASSPRRPPLGRLLAPLLAPLLAAAAVACAGERAAPASRAATPPDTAAPAAPPEDLTRADTTFAPALGVKLARMTRRPSGLYVLDRRPGAGTPADSNRWVTVRYTGWLADGTVIDDTRTTGGAPRDVLLGHGKVIPAWEEGLRGMRPGGRRLLVVPPALGYGAAGQPGTVPSRATLVFDVEMVRVH